MGFQYRNRGKSGTNFSLSSRGPRVSQTVRFGPLTFNFGKTLGKKANVRTRMNFGGGLFWTKQKTLGDSTQADVHRNLSNQFGIEDESEFGTKLSAWITCAVMILTMYFPFWYFMTALPWASARFHFAVPFTETYLIVINSAILLTDFLLCWAALLMTEEPDGLEVIPFIVINVLKFPLYILSAFFALGAGALLFESVFKLITT